MASRRSLRSGRQGNGEGEAYTGCVRSAHNGDGGSLNSAIITLLSSLELLLVSHLLDGHTLQQSDNDV